MIVWLDLPVWGTQTNIRDPTEMFLLRCTSVGPKWPSVKPEQHGASCPNRNISSLLPCMSWAKVRDFWMSHKSFLSCFSALKRQTCLPWDKQTITVNIWWPWFFLHKFALWSPCNHKCLVWFQLSNIYSSHAIFSCLKKAKKFIFLLCGRQLQ